MLRRTRESGVCGCCFSYSHIPQTQFLSLDGCFDIGEEFCPRSAFDGVVSEELVSVEDFGGVVIISPDGFDAAFGCALRSVSPVEEPFAHFVVVLCAEYERDDELVGCVSGQMRLGLTRGRATDGEIHQPLEVPRRRSLTGGIEKHTAFKLKGLGGNAS